MNTSFLTRSLMFVPAHNDRLLQSATRCNADVLLLDIEDSVQPIENKQVARDNIIKYIKEGKFNNRIIFPRINDRESGQLLKDVYQLTIEGVTGFMYPKARCGEDIYFIGKLLETIEYDKGFAPGTFKLIPLIETTGAVMNIQDICKASSRVVAVAFGCVDYVPDLGGKHDIEGESIFFARNMIVNGAHNCGKAAIDTVHIRVHDLEDLEKNLKISKTLGFDGMLILNPKELPLCHKYYSPSCEELHWANDMVQLTEDAVKEGKGVAVKDSQFIGPPMLRMAQDIILKYKLINKDNK